MVYPDADTTSGWQTMLARKPAGSSNTVADWAGTGHEGGAQGYDGRCRGSGSASGSG